MDFEKGVKVGGDDADVLIFAGDKCGVSVSVNGGIEDGAAFFFGERGDIRPAAAEIETNRGAGSDFHFSTSSKIIVLGMEITRRVEPMSI